MRLVPRPEIHRRLALTALAVGLVACWQWATVNSNYQGNWTALFCIGSKQLQPPVVQQKNFYRFPQSTGYDGAWYLYIAYDPLLKGDTASYLDDARVRYRRILVPLAAFALAIGQRDWIPSAYDVVFLLTVALGVYWSCALATSLKRDAVWGLLFLLIPATLIAADRLIVDAALAALTVGFLLYRNQSSWRLFAILAAAALVRETGLLLVAATCAAFARGRRWKQASVFALAAAPALLWYRYLAGRTSSSFPEAALPLAAILKAALHPNQYGSEIPLANFVLAADYLALLGAMGAVGAAIYVGRRLQDAVQIALVLFALLAIAQPLSEVWEHVYHYGRVFTPLLLCLALIVAQTNHRLLLLPWAMMLPRIAMQLAPQLKGVLLWIA